MALTLKNVKLYCHIDDNIEDSQVSDFMEAAQALILEQCGKTKYIGNDGTATTDITETKLFQTAEKQLISYWFDNRTAASNANYKETPFTVDMLIAHIKYSKEYA
jgi:uncharacterized phage protein (predicted DNA packaging)